MSTNLKTGKDDPNSLDWDPNFEVAPVLASTTTPSATTSKLKSMAAAASAAEYRPSFPTYQPDLPAEDTSVLTAEMEAFLEECEAPFEDPYNDEEDMDNVDLSNPGVLVAFPCEVCGSQPSYSIARCCNVCFQDLLLQQDFPLNQSR